jgi:hypothetical protein
MADEPEEEDIPPEEPVEPVEPVEPPPELPKPPPRQQENEADQQRGGKKATAPVPPRQPLPPSEGLEDLQRQLSEERDRSARAEAETRRLATERNQAIAYAQEAERRGISTQELMIEDQLKGMSSQLDTLVEQQTAAWNEGDFAKASQINRKLQELTVAHGFASEKKLWLTQQRERAAQQQQPRAAQPAEGEPPADPWEAKIVGKYTPQTVAFLRKHKDLVRHDGTVKRIAVQAHEAALDEGLVPDSQSYFDYVEKVLAGDNGAMSAAEPPPAPAPRAGAPSIAAPVSRGNVRVPGGGGKPTPTPTMRRLAAEQGVSVDDWMAHYQRLLALGKISPVQ